MLTSTATTAIIIFIITYAIIASEKIDKAIAAILGACIMMFLHLAPYDKLVTKIDMNVIFLLIGMMLIVSVLAVTGIFEWLAIVMAQKAKGNGVLIFIEFMVATAVLSSILDNVTTVILIAPITILLAQILEIPAMPILIFEAIFSNIGGTATLVGDPPNIIIGSQTDLVFNDFIVNLGPVVLIIIVISLLIIGLFFKSKFKVPENSKAKIMKAKPNLAIIEPVILKKALPILGIVFLGFFLSRFFEIEPGIIALFGGLFMVLVTKVNLHSMIEKVEWTTIMFFIGLFLIIGVLEINEVFTYLGEKFISYTHGNLMLTCILLLWASALLSAIVDNIPLVIAMIPLIKTIIPEFANSMGLVDPQAIHLQVASPLFWSLALGACLGGNGSLIGASANVVISQIAKRNKYKMSFWDFSKYGFPVMVLSLVICTCYIYVRFFSA